MVQRRAVLQMSLACAALAPGAARAAPSAPSFPPVDERSVWLVGDSAPPDPARTAALYARLAAAGDMRDSYLHEGAVASLEKMFADFLGKEDCAFFGTGTLANNVAVRALCGDNRRAVVQHESHLYRDEADAAQILGGINLVALAPGRADISLEEIKADVEAAENGPYPVKIGAIALESPVRRKDGELVSFEAARAISAYAREKKIGLHLDGARLLLAPPDFRTKSYAALFDTVYISLYKYLDAPFGAVLAGPKDVIEKARHLRHLYGGLIYQGWVAAAPALESMKTFPTEIARAHLHAEKLFAALESSGRARLRRVANASNINFIEVDAAAAEGLFDRCRLAGVRAARPKDGALVFFTNETILRRPVEEYVQLFLG
ncbi:MAG: beta-eliminating lyase-related protein [Pseudomonadota bacterium]|nr:beta-eliminating lyase-related protein [Pseudomonadota bacterium]